MELKCGAESEKEISFRCVQCGFSVTTLYIQYSPGNIRLMKCGNCKAVADEYIECELMILVIDLILHKIKAYRHLFYNRFSRETLHNEVLLWKLSLGFLILDAYQMLAVCTTQDERSLPASFASFLGLCGKVLMGVFFGNLMFLGIILFGTRRFLNAKIGDSRCKHILLLILISSYFKIFVIAMMVWEFPSSVVFIIKMFVLSSNALALMDAVMIRCIWICFAAHAMKFLVTQGLGTYQKLVLW
ncbi:protein ARV 2 isoform X2 [Solanum dulcamara]|uniref:protein ARV 2 isoform X2 n=1 Tax=Solanum dulcamara TaxID=45834 RepID=UPI002485E4E4|nr:protein ARV 2 isoform X2 [Solanum dulcamara]